MNDSSRTNVLVKRCARATCNFANFVVALAALAFAPFVVHAQTFLGNIPVNTQGSSLAINPITNKIYLANYGDRSISVIDGATHATVTLLDTSGTALGEFRPSVIAINTVTNKVYIANVGSNSVTVLDGATNSTTRVVVGTYPNAIAINPQTNKIYVSNGWALSEAQATQAGTVSVIDGATNAVTSIAVGTYPRSIAVNPITNKIYVANYGSPTNGASGDITLIDGATNTTSTIGAGGAGPISIAVNPVTNKAYVANGLGRNYTAYDANNNHAETTYGLNNGNTNPNDDTPRQLALNPVTNKVYITSTAGRYIAVVDGTSDLLDDIVLTGSNLLSGLTIDASRNKIYVASINTNGSLHVLDGATNTLSLVTVGAGQGAMAVNPVTNRVYVLTTAGLGVVDGATNTTSTATTAASPGRVVVNPLTNKIYTTATGNSSVIGYVTALDGANNARLDIPMDRNPSAIELNPLTNKVHVVNNNGSVSRLTTIDGANNTPTHVTVGGSPVALALNTQTNTAYIGHTGVAYVTVVDVATNTPVNVLVGPNPTALAVNELTGRVFVACAGANWVAAIDGTALAGSQIAVGTNPVAVAVNALTNKAYVANLGSNSVSVINGATLTATSIASIPAPNAIAVNALTNRIYVANGSAGTVTVINGATDTVIATVTVGTQPRAIAVNSFSNKIYVTNGGSNSVSVIDGITNAVSTVAVGTSPLGLAVNPVTEKIYVANNGASNVTIINPATTTQNTHSITVNSPSGAFTSTPNPTLVLNVSNAYSPNEQAVRVAHTRVGSRDGMHVAASGSGPFNAAISGLQPGVNYISLFAIDALEGNTANGSAYLGGTTTLIGAPKIHAIAYAPLCDYGSYSTTGSIPCTTASVGSYVPTIGATAQLPCPSGTTSNAGAFTCTGTVLNIDGGDDATKYDAATDGILLMRYLAGFRGAALIGGALGPNPTRNTALLIQTHIVNNLALFDVDGDGVVLPMTDGLMILRRLLNPKAINAMTTAEQAAITANTKRGTLTDAQVLLRIEALKPE